nr:right-handed parallel beta-helix repeat-containing protein [Planctomycetota bacterium]
MQPTHRVPRPLVRLALGLTAALADLAQLQASDPSVPGAVSAPNPTTCGIALVWPFSGDDNGNGRVTVRYRPVGGTYQTGMPLFRVPAGATSDGVSWTSRHAGSLFDLQPATTYEIELTLNDPDGGGTVRTLAMSTRAVPAPMAGAPVKAVTPATFNAVAAGAQPGDILQLADGTYAPFTWNLDGEAARPLVLRGGPGTVIDGNIDLFGRSYVQFDGLTIEGRLRINQCLDVAVQRCAVHAHADRGGGDGIVSYTRSVGTYIADNTVIGTTVWAEPSLGAGGANQGEGIDVTGPGLVIRNNRVHHFRDGVALLEGDLAVDQFSIDIVENDISECADDGIQADSALHNVRVLRNRLTNCFMGLSSQPGYGGPLYLVRNVLYNIVFESFKLHNGTTGDVLLNNTVVKSGDAFGVFSGNPILHTFTRNNLLIGGPGHVWNGYDSGDGRVMDLVDLDTATVSLDYDGFGSTNGLMSGKFGPSVHFATLAELRSLTTEVHATQVGLGVFAASVTLPDAAMTSFAAPDLRLAAGAAAIDAGIAITGITDGFAGAAPDLGAYEFGQAIPTYGPRVSGGGGDVTPPATPAAPTVSNGTTATPTLSGTTEAGATIHVFDGGVLIVTATADGSGHWSVLLPTLGTGDHNLTVTASDASGNTSGPSPDVVVTVAGGVPTPPGGGPSTPVSSGGGGGGAGCGMGAAAALVLLLSLASGLHQ